MIVLYPNDKSIHFLNVASVELSKHIELIAPQFGMSPLNEIFELIRSSHPETTIIYMGHGNPEELNQPNGEDTIITASDATKAFKGKKIILLSCFSAYFLNRLNDQFAAAIGFGDIITSAAEVKDHKKYGQDGYACIDLFRERLATLFYTSIVQAYKSNFTFLQLYNLLRLNINRNISYCSLQHNGTERLVGELMFELKKEMILRGNPLALVKGV